MRPLPGLCGRALLLTSGGVAGRRTFCKQRRSISLEKRIRYNHYKNVLKERRCMLFLVILKTAGQAEEIFQFGWAFTVTNLSLLGLVYRLLTC